MRILVIGLWYPLSDRSAGDRRLLALLALLAQEHEIYFASLRPTDPPADVTRSRAAIQAAGVRTFPDEGLPAVERALFRRTYDVCFVEFWTAAAAVMPLVRWAQPWCHLIVDTIDVHFLREEMALKFGRLDSETVLQNKRREIDTYRQADAVVVVTNEDGIALQAVGGIPRPWLIPNIFSSQPRQDITRSSQVLFVGGFSHAPNADAIAWFVSDIWPAILSEVPDAELVVVGSNPTPGVQALAHLPGVHVPGHVPDTTPFLEQAVVSVAPLRFGAGMKGKVCEAMAAGLAVVSTSVGAQGLEAQHRKHIMLADDAPTFARHVISLLKDQKLSLRLGMEAQAHITGICGPSSVMQSVRALLREPRRSRSIGDLVKWRCRSIKSFLRSVGRALHAWLSPEKT